GNGDIDLLRMRQPKILHIPGEVVFTEVAAEARIEAPLLAHSGGGDAAIIVRGIKEAILGQGEDLLMDGAVHEPRVAALERGPAAAPHQEAIAGERHALVVEHISEAARGMARRLTDAQIPLAEAQPVALREITVGSLGTAVSAKPDLAAEALLHHPGRGDVIG